MSLRNKDSAVGEVTRPLYAIFGAGPAGCWTARALREFN
jgi:hypothetical protein